MGLFSWLFGPTEKDFKKMPLNKQVKFMEKNRQGKVRIRERRKADRKFKKGKW